MCEALSGDNGTAIRECGDVGFGPRELPLPVPGEVMVGPPGFHERDRLARDGARSPRCARQVSRAYTTGLRAWTVVRSVRGRLGCLSDSR
jgi:hypothetical protein